MNSVPSNATKQADIKLTGAVPMADVPALSLDRRLSPIADERVTEVCECVLDIIAALFNVSGRELRGTGRSSTSVTRVRQIGMYAAHVTLGLNMAEVGRGFGRDRTTVQYACHLIEDMRDDEEFDSVVSMTERVVTVAFRHTEVR